MRGVPSEAETRRRMAFQALHPEVGISWLDGRWLAYWLDGDGRRQQAEAGTLGELLDDLAEVSGAS